MSAGRPEISKCDCPERKGRAIALESPSSLLPLSRGRSQEPPLGNALDGRTGRRAAPSSPLPPGSSPLPPFRGEVGRGVDPGGRAARTGTFPIPLIRELPGSAGVPPAWRAEGPRPRSRFARGRRDAGAPSGGTPLPTSPLKGGGVRVGRGRSADREVVERGGGPRRLLSSPLGLLSSPLEGGVGRSGGASRDPPPVDPGAGRPGRGASRPRSSVNRLGAPASRRLGGPKARILVRASREAGGTPAHPAAGPPSRPPP